MKNLINKQILLIFTGFLILLMIIWNRFIRIRIPKDLPFKITDITFICLSIICLILLFSLILLLISLFFSNLISNRFSNLSEFYTESLQELDASIKRNSYIWNHLYNVHISIFDYGRKYLYLSKPIYFLFHLPKIVLPIILFIEVFFIGRINVFYASLIFLILPLLYRYIYHSLHYFYAREILLSDERLTIKIQKIVNNDVVIYTILSQPTHYFIQETTLERLNIRQNVHEFIITLSDQYIQKHPYINREIAFNKFTKNFQIYSKMYELIHDYTMIHKKYIRIIHIFTLTIYFICWSFILYNGTYALSEEFITFWVSIKDIVEPFSGLNLNNTKNENIVELYYEKY